MSSFSIPLSGLSASSQALNIISNDLANLNTVGFKDQEASFEDLFYQNLSTNGAGNPVQEGMGTKIGSVSTNYGDGTVQSTNVASNVAITGNGFFISENASGVFHYTRSGNFGADTNGNLITSAGDTVLGYQAVNGVVNSGGALGPLNVGSDLVSAPSATTTIQQQTNLDATAPVGTTYSTPLAVYDSLGASHILTFNFTETAANTWSYQVTLPAADTGGTGNPTVVGSGSLSFDSSGNLASPTGSITGISVSGLSDGAATMNLTWNLANSSGGSLITQVASPSTTSTIKQNGYGSGTLSTYMVDADGTIEGTFTNGQTQALGQIALASFSNVQGLQAIRRQRLCPDSGIRSCSGRGGKYGRARHAHWRSPGDVERGHFDGVHPADRDATRV